MRLKRPFTLAKVKNALKTLKPINSGMDENPVFKVQGEDGTFYAVKVFTRSKRDVLGATKQRTLSSLGSLALDSLKLEFGDNNLHVVEVVDALIDIDEENSISISVFIEGEHLQGALPKDLLSFFGSFGFTYERNPRNVIFDGEKLHFLDPRPYLNAGILNVLEHIPADQREKFIQEIIIAHVVGLTRNWDRVDQTHMLVDPSIFDPVHQALLRISGASGSALEHPLYGEFIQTAHTIRSDIINLSGLALVYR